MASKIFLEFNQPTLDQPVLFTKHRPRSCTKAESKLLKTMSSTPRDSENLQLSPSRKSKKILEVRRIAYQPKQPRTPHSESHSQNSIKTRVSSKIPQRNSSISPEKHDLKRLRKYKAVDTQDLDSIPASEPKTYYNERVQWSKRKKGDLPLCIINFNGIFGDFFRVNFWSSEEQRFHLVEGVRPGLKVLMSEYYVAIVSWYNRNITKNLLSMFEEIDLAVDAVYIVRHRKNKHRFRHNYTQIYEDFAICDISTQILIIACVCIQRNEIIERKNGEGMLYEKSASGSNKFSTIGLPTTCEECPIAPLTVLVPHYRLSEDHISFFELAKFVYQIKIDCQGDFGNAHSDGLVSLPCEHKEIPVLPVLHPVTDHANKYILFLQYKMIRARPPIIRKSSRIKST